MRLSVTALLLVGLASAAVPRDRDDHPNSDLRPENDNSPNDGMLSLLEFKGVQTLLTLS